jgi:hypothetical protein
MLPVSAQPARKLFPQSLPHYVVTSLLRFDLCLTCTSKLSTVNPLTPVESALPQNPSVSPSESALPNSLDLKSFRIRTCKKRWGEGGGLLTRILPAQCCPRRNSSTTCSLVRIENARIDNVVVLSVQFRNTLASETNRFGTSWVWPNRLVTKCLGSSPIRHVPVSCRLYPGISG